MQTAIQILNWGHLGDLWLLAAAVISVRLMLNLAATSIESMEPAGASRLRLAWAAAVMPGLAFLILAPEMIHTLSPREMPSFVCVAHCFGLGGLVAAVTLNSAWKTWRRSRSAADLLKIAHRPSIRLARLAEEMEVEACELPTEIPVCAVAGIWCQRVLVSRGALARTSDDELRAALAHERAHLRRRETIFEAAAVFLNACTVAPAPETLRLYRRSREFAADREAAEEQNPISLANALLSFAKFELPQPTVQLAEPANLRERVSLLLAEESNTKKAGKRGACVATALIGVSGLFAILPAGAHLMQRLICLGRM